MTAIIAAIILSVFALEQIYEDARSLDRDQERIDQTDPDTRRAWLVAFVCVGAIWGLSLALSSAIGAVFP